eukprot:c5806_g1_i1.p1 GENE.c5806_g1_i1~~c5806_g1_i1.p1  ORF type:complete len:274 (-),score=54.89 c5806_g1_i1:53-874(-)
MSGRRLPFRPQLVVFDKDGTLIDFNYQWGSFTEILSKRLHSDGSLKTDVSQALFDAFGYCAATKKVISGGAVTDTPMPMLRQIAFNVLITKGNMLPDDAEVLLTNCWQPPDPIQTSLPLADIRKLFEWLRTLHIKVAINTTDSRDATTETMKFLGVLDLIDLMFCGDDALPSKPAPDSCLFLCSSLQVTPENTIMVGDTVADMRMSHAANLGLAIGVAGGSTSSDTLLKEADIVVSSVERLYFLLDLWCSEVHSVNSVNCVNGFNQVNGTIAK